METLATDLPYALSFPGPLIATLHMEWARLGIKREVLPLALLRGVDSCKANLVLRVQAVEEELLPRGVPLAFREFRNAASCCVSVSRSRICSVESSAPRRPFSGTALSDAKSCGIVTCGHPSSWIIALSTHLLPIFDSCSARRSVCKSVPESVGVRGAK